jgi:2-amino-4-hydroxy-6-hydroxymethyldihydropteridine diphosphokinase
VEPAYIGLGANTGDAAARLGWAAGELARLGATRMSALWRSAPLGPMPDQPWFVNAVARVTTPLAPATLLDALQEIERRAGRDRAHERRMGPRPLGLDLLLVGALVTASDRLVVPHPRLAARAFALAPLVELAGPDLVIPGAGRAGDLLARALADPAQTIARL